MANNSVAMVLLQSLYEYHFGIELELIERLCREGKSVHLVTCQADLPTCQANPNHKQEICRKCIFRTQEALRRVDGSVSIHRLRDLVPDIQALRPADLGALENETALSLQKRKVSDLYPDFAVGLSSSLISRFRDTELPLRQVTELLNNLVHSTTITFHAITNLHRREPFSVTYVFNGRFSEYRAMIRASERIKVPFVTYERGASFDRFELYPGVLPHDYHHLHSRAMELARTTPPEELAEEGGLWYKNRRRGVVQEWLSYTKDQVAGSLPAEYGNGKKNVVIYNSSEDEFAAIGEDYANPLFSDQMEALEKVVEYFAIKSDCNVFLRVHPNLKGLRNEQTRRFEAIRAPNFYLIAAESSISSYALLSQAWKVVTFGSQMGIEAVYWGVPSVLVGRSRFCLFSGLVAPTSQTDLYQALNEDLLPPDRQGALAFGYYFRNFGNYYKYFEPNTFYSGRFKGWAMTNSRIETWQNTYPYLFGIANEIVRLVRWLSKSLLAVLKVGRK